MQLISSSRSSSVRSSSVAHQRTFHHACLPFFDVPNMVLMLSSAIAFASLRRYAAFWLSPCSSRSRASCRTIQMLLPCMPGITCSYVLEKPSRFVP